MKTGDGGFLPKPAARPFGLEGVEAELLGWTFTGAFLAREEGLYFLFSECSFGGGPVRRFVQNVLEAVGGRTGSLFVKLGGKALDAARPRPGGVTYGAVGELSAGSSPALPGTPGFAACSEYLFIPKKDVNRLLFHPGGVVQAKCRGASLAVRGLGRWEDTGVALAALGFPVRRTLLTKARLRAYAAAALLGFVFCLFEIQDIAEWAELVAERLGWKLPFDVIALLYFLWKAASSELGLRVEDPGAADAAAEPVRAGLLMRAGAFAIDAVLVLSAGDALTYPSEIGLGLLAFLYFAGFTAWKGLTPGQFVGGLHVAAADGDAPGPFRAAARVAVSFASMGVGFLFAAGGQKEALHDGLTRTEVVYFADVSAWIKVPLSLAGGAAVLVWCIWVGSETGLISEPTSRRPPQWATSSGARRPAP